MNSPFICVATLPNHGDGDVYRTVAPTQRWVVIASSSSNGVNTKLRLHHVDTSGTFEISDTRFSSYRLSQYVTF